MTRRLRSVVGLALLVHTTSLAAEWPPSVRLVEVTSESTAASQSVLITATAPASYTTRQPDPLTVLVTLRDVAAGDVASRLRPAPGALVAAVEVVDGVDHGGNPVAHVRIGLREPTTYEVRSRQLTIQIRFARPAPSAPAPVDGAAAASLVARGRPATALLSVEPTIEPHAVSVTLRGNGVLSPAQIHEAEHLPPRLIIDFAHLAVEADSLSPVEIDPVKQVRVAANSDELTRVVFDLVRPAVYHIEQLEENEGVLRVVFPRDRAVDPVARIGGDPATDMAAAGGLDAETEAQIEAMAERLAQPDPSGVAPPPVAFAVVAVPLARPDPRDVPQPVWPEIPQLAGPVAFALDPASAPLLHPDAGDLPSRVVDASVSVTPAAAEVSIGEPEPETTEVAGVVERSATLVTAPPAEPTATTAVAASRQTERFLPLSGSGLASGASEPRAAIQLPGQPAPSRQEYTGDPISMDFQGSDLRAVLRVFAEISGLNIVIDPSVQGEVNVALTQVPWDQAFDIILRANGLDYEVDGTVVRIASVQQLQQEAQDRALLAQRNAGAGELVVFTRTLSYARAEDLVQLITATTLSPRGEVFTDPRTNTLIIRDLADRLTTLGDLLDTLDRAEPQVEIEARIVQAGHDSARALGVQWGVTGRVAQEIGNTLPFSFPNRGGLTGRVGSADGQGPSGLDSRALPDENAATAVNLGVSAATSALGLTMGSVNGALNLDVVLSALESQGELSIISSPRVTTQNNVQAEILQGDQIPYQTVANNTVTVQFKEAALTLRVTPQITAANTVIMQVELENSFADFGRALGDPPIPSIVTQRALTTIQVGDGETAVIGGIYENAQTARNNRTPVLHRIPLLGWLFRSTDRTQSTDELMIFLTPRIVAP